MNLPKITIGGKECKLTPFHPPENNPDDIYKFYYRRGLKYFFSRYDGARFSFIVKEKLNVKKGNEYKMKINVTV